MEKEDVTYQYKLNELKLDISHPNSKGINFVLVEGKSDIRLFRKLFNFDKCKVQNIPGGKIKLEECVSDLLKKHHLIIGIRDADFIHLNDKVYSKHNMFLTDFHDIEITILAQEDVLNALFFEYTNLPKEKHIDLRNNMMKSIEKLGCLKWLNDRENLEFKFSAGFQDLISFADKKIDFSKYLKRVLSKSDNARIKDKDIIQRKIDSLVLEKPDLLQLTNGHDLLKIFAKYFNEKTNHKRHDNEDLATAIRMSFTANHFEKTKLYIELLAWGKEKNTKLF